MYLLKIPSPQTLGNEMFYRLGRKSIIHLNNIFLLCNVSKLLYRCTWVCCQPLES